MVVYLLHLLLIEVELLKRVHDLLVSEHPLCFARFKQVVQLLHACFFCFQIPHSSFRIRRDVAACRNL
ncbi:hypothetical protein SDC9_82589 [bioreactor metagenome]|uniref:Uncharacterized protein n=1 Tax=bioreactor metagenome TaxID=1076179 RepID=A0A644ZDM5_9ZZZZ